MIHYSLPEGRKSQYERIFYEQQGSKDPADSLLNVRSEKVLGFQRAWLGQFSAEKLDRSLQAIYRRIARGDLVRGGSLEELSNPKTDPFNSNFRIYLPFIWSFDLAEDRARLFK